MDELPVNTLDLIVLGVLLVSGIVAFIRGFVHETLSIFGWLAAGLIALYALPWTGPFARQYVEPGWIADSIAGGAVFLVALLVLSLITHALSRRIRQSALNSLDRALGFLFGLARGALLVVLAYMLGVWLLDGQDPPEWLAEAKTRPMMETGAEFVQAALPEYVATARGEAEKAAAQAREIKEAEEMFRSLAEPQPRAEEEQAPSQPGYDTDERREMDRLFQSNQ